MTLTSSGQISINDINGEFGRSGTTANSSLEDLSDGTVATINTANASGDRPDTNAPHNMSEFYSYNHSASSSASFGTWSDTTIRFVGAAPGDGIQNHAATTSALTSASGTMACDDTVTSGTARASVKVAISNSGDPGAATGSFTGGGTSNSGSGYEGIGSNAAIGSVAFSGSVTAYVRFAMLPHSTLTETVNRTMSFTNNNTADTNVSVYVSVASFGGLCVSEVVPVNCKDYYKHISELSVGDKVMSYNFETDSVEEVEILKIEKPKHSDLVIYRFEDDEDICYGHDKTLTVNRGLSITKDHPIYKSDGTMVCLDPAKAKELYGLDAQEIKKGDEIRFMDKIRKVEKYLLSPEETETYTILTKNNNFYAGGVLVHSEIGG